MLTLTDGGILNSTAEAYNADHAFKLAKQLRKIPVIMAVLKPASSTRDFYWIGLTIPAFEKKGQLVKKQDSLLICDAPASEQTQDVKLEREHLSRIARFCSARYGHYDRCRRRIASRMPNRSQTSSELEKVGSSQLSRSRSSLKFTSESFIAANSLERIQSFDTWTIHVLNTCSIIHS